VGLLVLVVDDKLMTDLTSIGTLFAFVLVSGGVLLLPRLGKQPGKFNLPYLNGKWIVPALFILFVWGSQKRIGNALTNISKEGYQEVLLLIFLLVFAVTAILTFMRNYSIIPVMGVLCCAYLMIEIPAKSWVVFFGWMAIGLAIYFMYGYKKSKLARMDGENS
jgi:basic amino acid/polyamine antiporter, APA family